MKTRPESQVCVGLEHIKLPQCYWFHNVCTIQGRLP